MFCDCLNDPDEKTPNTNICPICLAHPGTLPVANKAAIEKVILVGMALHADIPAYSQFDRKNYFYPDLPKGYQISQYEHPFVKEGYLDIKLANGAERRIRITRVHLEEDTGRLQHDKTGERSLVDFNRAGIPLMELVTEPDMRSAEEARRFGEELQRIIRYVGASDADMEKGEMRVEANVSIRPKGAKEFGTKVEVKNINSFRNAEKAIEYEVRRQAKVLESGEKVVQETRGWDDVNEVTVSQRTKEGAKDYRYFPEPDLPPLMIDQKWLAEIRSRLTELPGAKRLRFQKEYGLDDKTIELFISDPHLAQFFEQVVSEMSAWLEADGVPENRRRAVRLAANYLTSDLQSLRKSSGGQSMGNVTAENFGELVALVYEDKISSAGAKQILTEMFQSGGDPSDIMETRGLVQESSDEFLREIVGTVIKNNPDIITSVRAGKTTAVQALVGAAMKASQGKGNPARLRELIDDAIQTV
jgi:aspartyl-tRNA(Asn)/glutamyl-tRNA(Gln) amidotransferase subunit B